MRISTAIGAALALAAFTLALLRAAPSEVFAALPYFPLIGALLGIWVAVDSARLRVREYATSLGYRPFVLFVLAALWPIIVVPWYLTVREGILEGRTPRKGGR